LIKKQQGVIYIGRLPYGWVEEGIKEYFTQFGDVLGVKLHRSKKVTYIKKYFVRQIDQKDMGSLNLQIGK
jgi:nucleolar protein 15